MRLLSLLSPFITVVVVDVVVSDGNVVVVHVVVVSIANVVVVAVIIFAVVVVDCSCNVEVLSSPCSG